MYVVKIACERPDELGRSLSQWDCTEIARQLVRDGVVTKIAPETVRQILRNHRLKPWRQKMWLSAKVPRDAAFAAQVEAICDLYTRLLPDDEMVLAHVWGEVAFRSPGAAWISFVFRGLLRKQPQIS